MVRFIENNMVIQFVYFLIFVEKTFFIWKDIYVEKRDFTLTTTGSGFWHLLNKPNPHQNETDHETVQAWDKMVEEKLIRILVLPIPTKCIFFFYSPFRKNNWVKLAWFEEILRWMTFWEVSPKACKWRQNTLKKLVLVHRIMQQYLKSYWILQVVSE